MNEVKDGWVIEDQRHRVWTGIFWDPDLNQGIFFDKQEKAEDYGQFHAKEPSHPFYSGMWSVVFMRKERSVKGDAVNHPTHYTFGKFEVIDVLTDWFPKDPILWQVGKYIARAGHKGNLLQDLEKAAWYLNRKIQDIKKETQK